MIIRANQLRKDDLFIKQNSPYVVVGVTEEKIWYTYYMEKQNNTSGKHQSMGAKSQERVEYIGTRPKTKITKPKIVYENSI